MARNEAHIEKWIAAAGAALALVLGVWWSAAAEGTSALERKGLESAAASIDG